MTKLEQLEQLANAATLGPWRYCENGISFIETVDAIYGPDKDLHMTIAEYMGPSTGKFMAAVDPQTVLKLVAVVKAVKELYLDPYERGNPLGIEEYEALQRALGELDE